MILFFTFYTPILNSLVITAVRALLRINGACLHLTADDNATIRVTNLSEDTRETDLQELFRPFGSISRIYLAKDKNTGQSKVSAHLKNTKTCTFLKFKTHTHTKNKGEELLKQMFPRSATGCRY